MRTTITRLRRRPSPGTTLAAAAAILVGSGVAYAAIPSGDGTIKGCYATTNGLLLGVPHSKGDTRIVDADEACRSYERAIAWNQQGPKGDTGAAGATRLSVQLGDTVEGSDPRFGTVRARCPEGERATGGGYIDVSGTSVVNMSRPIFTVPPGASVGDAPTGWEVGIEPEPGATLPPHVQVYAICAAP